MSMMSTWVKAAVAVSLVFRSVPCVLDVCRTATLGRARPVRLPPAWPLPWTTPMQAPATQSWLAAHATPQAPQLRLFDESWTQLLPHSARPTGHPQIALEQTWPLPHAVAQVPQCFASLVRSAQLPLQSVNPWLHMLPTGVHWPATHGTPTPHTVPQAPQFFGSLFLSTQKLPHLVLPPPQVTEQTPAEQTWLALHVVPQAPQFLGSLLLSTQRLPHLVLPPPQVRAHTPAEQTWPALHTVPQAPQLLGS